MSILDDMDFDDFGTFEDDRTDDVWTTRDGRMMRVHEMGDTHLFNAIRYLKRKAAMLVATRMELGMMKFKPSEITNYAYPILAIMEDEWERRQDMKKLTADGQARVLNL